MTVEVRDHVVAAILRNGSRVLLCHRTAARQWYPDVWDLPGGHVEVGETELVALKRELREELGIELSRPLERPFARLADDATGLHMTIWLIDYEGQISNCAPGEHDELRWIAGHDIAGVALAHASYPEILGRALVAAAQ